MTTAETPASNSLASPFVRNCLVLCGLWFAYGFIGIPLSGVFNQLVVNDRIFNGLSGHFLMRVLGSLVFCIVAAALGASLPRVIASPRLRPWATVFALYIGCLHLLGFHPVSPVEAADVAVEVFVAVLLVGSAFLGYVVASRRSFQPRAPSSGVSGA